MDVTQTHPLEQLNTVIQDTCSHFDDYRKNPGDFTRNRKLPVDTLIKTVLNMEGERIDAELVKAFPDFDERMSESAFEQQKAKLTLVSATSIVEGGAHDVIQKDKSSAMK